MTGKVVVNKWSASLIRRLRGKRTQDEFGRILGAPKNTVWRWEAGYAIPAAIYSKKLSSIAAQEGFLGDWQAVGSITWVGDLEEGSREIALEFAKALGSGRPRTPAKSKALR